MTILKPLIVLTTAAALTGAALLSASAQTTPPPSPTTPPAAKPEPAPLPPAQKPAPRPDDKSATNPAKANPLVGLAVFSSDGTKMGNVQSVHTGPDGKTSAIHIKTGGFLGIGGKMVAIPEGKFTKTGDRLQLSMTADEVGKLPEVKDNS
jgi:PRC-barrel domain protein